MFAELPISARAPALTPADLIQALRERIDPVFLPRPLLFVDVLPRNATGKFLKSALREQYWDLLSD